MRLDEAIEFLGKTHVAYLLQQPSPSLALHNACHGAWAANDLRASEAYNVIDGACALGGPERLLARLGEVHVPENGARVARGA
jgi:hypothetical protein